MKRLKEEIRQGKPFHFTMRISSCKKTFSMERRRRMAEELKKLRGEDGQKLRELMNRLMDIKID